MIPEYNRREITRECSKQLKIAGYKRIMYRAKVTDQEGRTVVIPLVLLNEHDNVIVAIRVRKPKKRQDKTIPKRSETIASIAGCKVVIVHSKSEARALPSKVKELLI